MNKLKLLNDLATMGVDEEYHALILNSQEYLTLKDLLTPPTQEEVCKAIGGYYQKEVYYEADMFVIQNYKIKRSNKDLMITQMFTSGLKFYIELPPYLITMISRFYEGKDNDE